jgi:hypothetical protein
MNTVIVPARRYRFRVSRRVARLIAALEVPVELLNAEREFWRRQAEDLDRRICAGLNVRQSAAAPRTKCKTLCRTKSRLNVKQKVRIGRKITKSLKKAQILHGRKK